MICKKCGSNHVVKNGINVSGSQQYLCRKCSKGFVENPKKSTIDNETINLIDRLLLEKIPLAGISRATGVSQRWLQTYVNEKYSTIPQKAQVKKKANTALIVQCDEMWSFVGKKKNKLWLWFALDAQTREIIGFHPGCRNAKGAKALWNSLPKEYQRDAFFHTDFWEAYKAILPSKKHRADGKESGLTSYIERFNCTLRQRVSRLVRKTLSFSKKLQNHIGGIWNFIHYYNYLINGMNII